MCHACLGVGNHLYQRVFKCAVLREPGPEYPVEDKEIAPEKQSHVCETIAT